MAFLSLLSVALEQAHEAPEYLCDVLIIIWMLIKLHPFLPISRINNQRNDYMTAYENHMLEIKKELRQLQEKVLEIANDRWETGHKSVVVLHVVKS